jgi:pimeloyl-ACP methyl ester carboxylesterase
MVMPGIGLPERAMTPQPGGRYLWHMGFHSVPDIPELLIQGHLREYMQWFFYDNSAVPEAVSRESLDHYVEIYSQPGALRAFLQYYRNLWRSGEQIRVHSEHKLPIPVMAYGGDASLGEYAEHGMGRLAANVTAGVTRNCGHWVAEEQPAFVRDRIMEFCASSPSSEES